MTGFVIGVFQNSHAKSDGSLLQNNGGSLLNDFCEVFRILFVNGGTAFVVAKTNNQHFAKSALKGTHKVGVQLDPVDGDYQIPPHRQPGSNQMGRPEAVWPRRTVSTVVTTGTPRFSGVMP